MEKVLPGCQAIEIHSDCQAIILSMAGDTIKGKMAIQCAKWLALLANSIDIPVKLRWIR